MKRLFSSLVTHGRTIEKGSPIEVGRHPLIIRTSAHAKRKSAGEPLNVIIGSLSLLAK